MDGSQWHKPEGREAMALQRKKEKEERKKDLEKLPHGSSI